MFYYPVLTTKKLPVIFFYASKIHLPIGQMVIVPLQNQQLEGIIFENAKSENEINELSIETTKIKEILEVKPFVLHANQIQFIKFLINNTFGNPGVILTTFLQSFKFLSAQSWRILQTNYEQNEQKITTLQTEKTPQNNLIGKNESLEIPKNLKNQDNIQTQNLQIQSHNQTEIQTENKFQSENSNSQKPNSISNSNSQLSQGNFNNSNFDKNNPPMITNSISNSINKNPSSQNKNSNLTQKIETKMANSPKEEKLVNYLEIAQKERMQKQIPQFNFWLELDYSLRIMYIIRNWKQKKEKELKIKTQNPSAKIDQKINFGQNPETQKVNPQENSENLEKTDFHKLTQSDKKNIFDIVIIFPEKKLLDKIYNNTINLPKWKNFLQKLDSENWLVENYFFSSQINKESRQTILALLGIVKEIKKPKKIRKIKLRKSENKLDKNLETENGNSQNSQYSSPENLEKNPKINQKEKIILTANLNSDNQNKILQIDKNFDEIGELKKTKIEIDGKKIDEENKFENLDRIENFQNSEKSEENNSKNPAYKIRLIWGTRSSLFLPFANLENIILIDEANSFHIQEQNGLYFDTREAVFLLHKASGIDLDFVSILPSIRFQSLYKKPNFDENLDKLKTDLKKTLPKNNQIKITKTNKKYDNYQLFSHQIEQILQTDQDYEYFDEDF